MGKNKKNKQKRFASVYEIEAKRSREIAEYIAQSGKNMHQYDIFISGSQLKSGKLRTTTTGYLVLHDGIKIDKHYYFMSDTSLPKSMLQTAAKVADDLPDNSVVVIHTADSFTRDFINLGWSGPKTKEEADAILEQRRKHTCLIAVMDESPELHRITVTCRNMMYK